MDKGAHVTRNLWYNSSYSEATLGAVRSEARLPTAPATGLRHVPSDRVRVWLEIAIIGPEVLCDSKRKDFLCSMKRATLSADT
jgi:hypothetical protein